MNANKSLVFLKWIEEKLNKNRSFELRKFNSVIRDEWHTIQNNFTLQKFWTLMLKLASLQGVSFFKI